MDYLFEMLCGADRDRCETVLRRSVQLACLVAVWFFVQGSGCGAFVVHEHMAPMARLMDSCAQCVGGVLGSAIVLVPLKSTKVGYSEKAERILCVLFIAVGAASVACAQAGLFWTATGMRVVSCAIVTVVFLEACICMVDYSTKEILFAFLTVAFCCVLQGFVFMPALSGPYLAVLSLILQVALLLFGVKIAPVDCDDLLSRPSDEPSCADAGSRAPEALETHESPDGSKVKSMLPWQFVIHVTLYYFVIGIMLTWESRIFGFGVVGHSIGLIASVVALLLYYLAFARGGNMQQYWPVTRQVTLPLAFLPFLLLLAPSAPTSLIAIAMAQIAYRFFLLASYVEMFCICKITQLHARRVFAGTHVALYLGILLGSTLGFASSFSPVLGHNDEVAIACVAFVSLVAASCWLGNDKSAGKLWGARVELTPKGKQDELLRERCGAIAKEYKLTGRETDVLVLMVEGNEIDQMAAKMYVSRNTVRTHVRNMYSKLDVHSRAGVCEIYEKAKQGHLEGEKP